MLREMVFSMRKFGFAGEFVPACNASAAIAGGDETKLGFHKQLKELVRREIGVRSGRWEGKNNGSLS